MSVQRTLIRRVSPAWTALMGSAICLTLTACGGEQQAAAPEARPVRTITVEKRQAGMPIALAGRIQAEDEAALGFRIAGRIIENNTRLGDPVQPGQVLARLEFAE